MCDETINPRYGAHPRRTTMFRKLTLALFAAASLGAAALAPTAASASPYKILPHHHHHFHGHHHGHGLGFVIGGGYGGGDCYQTRRVWTPYGFRFRVVNVCAW
jgi:hypothetical protein